MKGSISLRESEGKRNRSRGEWKGVQIEDRIRKENRREEGGIVMKGEGKGCKLRIGLGKKIGGKKEG